MVNPLLQFTITKIYDLEEQFHILWLRAHRVLKAYNTFDTATKLECIYNFYHLTEYKEMMCACLL